MPDKMTAEVTPVAPAPEVVAPKVKRGKRSSDPIARAQRAAVRFHLDRAHAAYLRGNVAVGDTYIGNAKAELARLAKLNAKAK